MSAAAQPKMIDTPRQPTSAMSGAPITAMTTVPRLPPAMWALIANPRRAGGNCSASRPLPTGCCGDPPIRATTLGIDEGQEAAGQGLGREPAAEQQAADPQQAAARHASGQLGVGQLDRAGREGPDRGQERRPRRRRPRTRR